MTAGPASAEPVLVHSTVIEIDRRGVLIRGPSGSGKTSLAIELLARCRACDIESALVADDYAFVSREAEGGDGIATAPDRTAGLIEFRGLGIVRVGHARHIPQTVLSLAVLLVSPSQAERVADPERLATIAGVTLPELALPEREPVQAAFAVLGWLGLSERVL